MAGLGEAASVIAVLQIAEDIGLKLFAYTQGVRHAKEDMTRLHSAVLAFRHVLEKVEDLKDHPSAMKLRTFQLLNQPNGPVEGSLGELLELRRRLNTGEGNTEMRRVGWRALKWPFQRKEVDKIVLALEGYKATFNMALTADNTQASLPSVHSLSKK
jgi:hypothetical protein